MRSSCVLSVHNLLARVDEAEDYSSSFAQPVILCSIFTNFLHMRLGVFQQVFSRAINRLWSGFTGVVADFATTSTRIIANTTSFNKKGLL